jgi:hypothetical protein
MAQTLYLPIQQVFTDLGLIGAGFKLETFKTGTSTPLATYSDTALTIANANPTIADSAGRFPQIFINDAKLYKAVLKDAEDNVVWTADPIDPKIFTLNDFDPRPTSFWGVTDGTSTVYTLAANPAITAYSSNQTFFLQFHIACGIAPTIAISELSALALKKSDGAGGKVDLEINDVLTGTYEARNDGTDIIILNPEKPFFDSRNLSSATETLSGVALLPKQITISNGTDTDHDIDFTAGNFQFDDGSGQAVATALTKQIDAVWSEGDNLGGLDTGTVAVDSTYHMFAIHNPTSGISDALFSVSLSPTMPSGYTKKKRVASLVTDGAANIRNGIYRFQNNGAYIFTYNISIAIINGSGNFPLTLTNITIPTPRDIKTSPSFDCKIRSSGSDGIAIADFDSSQEFRVCSCSNSINTGSLATGAVFSNNLSQIKYRNSGASAFVDFDFDINVNGWLDNNL